MRNLSQRSKQTEAFTACTNIWLHAISYKIAVGYKIVMHGITLLYVAIHLHALYNAQQYVCNMCKYDLHVYMCAVIWLKYRTQTFYYRKQCDCQQVMHTHCQVIQHNGACKLNLRKHTISKLQQHRISSNF